MSISMGLNRCGRIATLALVPIASGCGPVAAGNATASQPMATASATLDVAPTPQPTASSAVLAARCPATLTRGAVPNSARLLGDVGGAPIALSSATVTADAPSAIAADTSGMAEVTPEDGAEKSGVAVQVYDVAPRAERPYTLVCRYGATRPPLLAEAVLLLPIPTGARYACTTQLPQGASREPVSATCVADEN